MSLSIVVIYFNLLIYGYSFWNFLKMVLGTWEFYLLFLGIFLI